jgi:hypothetical protein
MKETKSLKVLLVFILLTAVMYNVMIGLLLNHFEMYQTENMFFVIKYVSHDASEHPMIAPQFMNWIFVVSFVFFTVMLWIRSYINKEMKLKRVAN